MDESKVGDKARDGMVIPPHGRGRLRPPWTAETAPKGKGVPKGFVNPTDAYRACAMLSVEDLERVVQGKIPIGGGWPASRKVTAGYAAMAGQILAAIRGQTPAAKEYADRVEGPVVAKVEAKSLSYVLEIPTLVGDVRSWADATIVAPDDGPPVIEGGGGNLLPAVTRCGNES